MGKQTDVTLTTLYQSFQGPEGGGDKGTIHSYIEIYEEFLKPNADLLEIGVYQGHSLAMFAKFFTGNVVGLDIDLTNLQFEVNAKICDATNKDSLEKTIGNLTFDYIIDDGSHNPDHQKVSLELLYKSLKPGGIYFIEDIISLEVAEMLTKTGKNLGLQLVALYDLRTKKGRHDDILLVFQAID
jgi:demethylmacrocin O-methyltransferase